MTKQERITAILNQAEIELKKEKVKYILSAVSREPEKKSGGFIVTSCDVSQQDLINVLDTTCPDNTSIAHLGIAVGELLRIRQKNNSKKEKSC